MKEWSLFSIAFVTNFYSMYLISKLFNFSPVDLTSVSFSNLLLPATIFSISLASLGVYCLLESAWNRFSIMALLVSSAAFIFSDADLLTNILIYILFAISYLVFYYYMKKELDNSLQPQLMPLFESNFKFFLFLLIFALSVKVFIVNFDTFNDDQFKKFMPALEERVKSMIPAIISGNPSLEQKEGGLGDKLTVPNEVQSLLNKSKGSLAEQVASQTTDILLNLFMKYRAQALIIIAVGYFSALSIFGFFVRLVGSFIAMGVVTMLRAVGFIKVVTETRSTIKFQL